MFKKAHDKMFKKAQMRLFSMIVGILLAVFVALIGSINVITKEVMRGQSKEVLKNIAAGTEYDDKRSQFVFPESFDKKEEKKPAKEKPTTAPATDAVTTEKPATSEANTTTQKEKEKEKVTDAPTDPPQEDTQAPEEYQEPYEEPNEEQPQETAPPETQAPETQPPATDASSGATPSWDPNSGQWNGQWGDPNNNGQWNGQWGDQNNNGQWNGQWGDQNGGQYDWSQWNNQNNGQWNGQWVYPWYPWMYAWGTWEQPKTYSSEYPVGRNDHGEMDPRYDTINDHGERDPRYDTVEEEKDSDDDVRIEGTAYSYSDDMSAYIKPLANLNDTSAMSADASGVQQSVPYRQVGVQQAQRIPKQLGSIDFFLIMADKSGQYLNKLNIDDMDKNVAQDYITTILDNNLDTGIVNTYQFYQMEKPNGTIMVFTDKSSEMEMLRQLKRTTIIIGSIALVILSVLAYFLSKKSIQPIKTAFNKQKQFVSDASHELKTPLTVISANADVLEGEIGDNKWLKYIKSQTDRMNVLVNDLLNLTRLENNTSELERKYFNLSKAIANTALPFECQAFENNKKFEVNIDENVMLCGSEKHIKQMAAIFIDNALKYSNDGGTVRVTLKKMGDRKLFSVYNTGEGIKEEETEKIFERFYRSDQSRNRATGGYGLGLAIAKSIIDKHKFKVHIMNQPGKSVCFVITM